MQPCVYTLYPALNPTTENMLQVDDIHTIYYEECGNPEGVPVVFLHGGPGSGCNPTQRRFFDPAFYRIILIDQRGSGRSRPLGEMTRNTTADLVADIELIREKLGITRWLVFGGSWGSTLALAYATAHTAQVSGLILRGIFLSRPTELRWFLGEVRAFFPEAWQTLCDFLPQAEQHDVLNAYAQRIFCADAAISIPAAIRWNAFEGSIMTLLPRSAAQAEVEGALELARARVQIHYIQHNCFIDGQALLNAAKDKLVNIPTIIVQGRYDMVCPPTTAWELKQAMPHATLQMVEDAGHSAMEVGITSALVAATEQFKSLT